MKEYTTNTNGERFYVGDVVSFGHRTRVTIVQIQDNGEFISSTSLLPTPTHEGGQWIPDNLVLLERPNVQVEVGWTL